MNFSPVFSLSLLQVNSHLSDGAGLVTCYPGNQENGGEGRGTCKRRNSTPELSWCQICCRLAEMHRTKIQIIYIMGPLIKKYIKKMKDRTSDNKLNFTRFITSQVYILSMFSMCILHSLFWLEAVL